MSATLSGLIVLENPRPIDGLPSSVMFDGQMWLGEGRVLTGIFRYYNSSNLSFPEVGTYFAWIHVARFVPGPPVHVNAQLANEGAEPQPETERQPPTPRDGQGDGEEVATANGDGSTSSDTLGQPNDVVHVVGDIAHLIPTKTDDMRQQVYINVSGATENCNKSDGSFEINAAQYTSHYRDNRLLSVLPVRAYFNLNKHKNKKPMPSNNTYVSVNGFLGDIVTDNTGHATRFHMSVDIISFLGSRATLSPSVAGGLGKGPSTPSRSSRFKYDFDEPSPSSSTQASALSVPSTPSTSATLESSEAGSPGSPGTPTRAANRNGHTVVVVSSYGQ